MLATLRITLYRRWIGAFPDAAKRLTQVDDHSHNVAFSDFVASRCPFSPEPETDRPQCFSATPSVSFINPEVAYKVAQKSKPMPNYQPFILNPVNEIRFFVKLKYHVIISPGIKYAMKT